MVFDLDKGKIKMFVGRALSWDWGQEIMFPNMECVNNSFTLAWHHLPCSCSVKCKKKPRKKTTFAISSRHKRIMINKELKVGMPSFSFNGIFYFEKLTSKRQFHKVFKQYFSLIKHSTRKQF